MNWRRPSVFRAFMRSSGETAPSAPTPPFDWESTSACPLSFGSICRTTTTSESLREAGSVTRSSRAKLITVPHLPMHVRDALSWHQRALDFHACDAVADRQLVLRSRLGNGPLNLQTVTSKSECCANSERPTNDQTPAPSAPTPSSPIGDLSTPRLSAADRAAEMPDGGCPPACIPASWGRYSAFPPAGNRRSARAAVPW